MPKYADWSPASVFGATAAAPRVSQELVMAHSGASRLKTKPGKADSLSSPPPAVKAVNNNDEQLEPQETKQQASEKPGPSRDLAAQILQRYGRMWLLRRHETQRLREVERLRGALRTAAIRVVTKSCVLYVKRRAIHDYLDHLTAFEARLDGLLGQVIVRKRRKEEERRLAVIHRQRVQRIEEQKRQVVRSWLAIRIEESWWRREQRQATAHSKLLAWVRRWKLKTRCQARAIAREQQQRRGAQRDRSAQQIASFYRTVKWRHEAKLELQRCIRIHNGLTRLGATLRLALLRTAQSRWQMRLIQFKQAEVAIRSLQRLCREHQAAARQAHRSACCVSIQRLFRGHLARALCSKLRRRLQHEAVARRRHAAATQLQRCVRGILARRRFAAMMHKLRERFRCANCGVLEPSGEYCKYCGRRRSTFGPLSSLLLPSEKPPHPMAANSTASESSMPTMDVSVPVVPPAKYQTGRRRHTRPRSLQSLGSSSTSLADLLQPLIAVPAVLSPRHHRLVPGCNGTLPMSTAPRKTKTSISEQTALRATALAELQLTHTAATQTQALKLHLQRLGKARSAASHKYSSWPNGASQ